MMSIMQKQAKMMETELKNKKQALLEVRAALDEKTARVVELEAQLGALTPTEEEKAEEKQVVDEGRLKELAALVESLGKQLKESDGKVTYEQLRASVLHMEKCTMKAKHIMDRFQLEKAVDAKDKEIAALRRELLERQKEALDATEAAEQVSRRDEQLEFLMNVHDASKDCDWVNPAGAPRNAAAALTEGYEDPVSFLEALGVDAATAIAVLEANGGDAQRAAASLFG